MPERIPYSLLDTNGKIRREQEDFDECMADADVQPISFDEHPLPWTARACFHDGAGMQFFDANGKPVFAEFIYHSPDLAATLLKTFNAMTP